MARDEAPPFARGETWYNGGTIDSVVTDTLGLGGINYEGKEFVFEVNAQDQETAFGNSYQDPSGRAVRVKVVRNLSGVNLLPARLAHWQAGSTTSGRGYKTAVDGYAIVPGPGIAGVIDEFLPPAGVPNYDLFYLVIDGPSQFTNVTGAVSFTTGDCLVAATQGATQGDPLGGRVAEQVLTNLTGVLEGNQILGRAGYADTTVAATTGTVFQGLVKLGW